MAQTILIHRAKSSITIGDLIDQLQEVGSRMGYNTVVNVIDCLPSFDLMGLGVRSLDDKDPPKLLLLTDYDIKQLEGKK